jgi:hypothetical protein
LLYLSRGGGSRLGSAAAMPRSARSSILLATTTSSGIGVLAGSYSDNSSGAARIYSSRIEFDVDIALVPDPDDLIVGLLDPVGSGDFVTLRFHVLKGATGLDQSFGDLAAALAVGEAAPYRLSAGRERAPSGGRRQCSVIFTRLSPDCPAGFVFGRCSTDRSGCSQMSAW